MMLDCHTFTFFISFGHGSAAEESQVMLRLCSAVVLSRLAETGLARENPFLQVSRLGHS
jgi:hypothetical protein